MTWYTVYEASTEEVIASGTGPQCAKALGMTMGGLLQHRQPCPGRH